MIWFVKSCEDSDKGDLHTSFPRLSKVWLKSVSLHTGSRVDEFLRFYRESFPHATITPKLHMLEDHVVSWMRRWHWAPGFHGEQGAESVHNVFNRLEHTYSAIRSPLDRMTRMLREHHLQTSPHAAPLQPTVTKRK